MDEIIIKTKNLIKALSESDLIKNLEQYKSLALHDSSLTVLIQKYNSTSDDYEKMALKKEIYQNDDYAKYMKYYNELLFLVMSINKRFKKYTKGGFC